MRAGRRSLVWVLMATFAIAAAALIWFRGSGLTSRRKPWPMEAWVARSTRHFFVPREMLSAVNPAPDSPGVRRAGMEHFADHCATCHANDGSGNVPMGRAMFPPAPDMRMPPTQGMTDGELFYLIERGIPFTGMPAWGNGSREGELSTWQLIRFIRYLPQLSQAELKEMQALNPRSPGDLQREKDIKDFLSGGRVIK